MMSSLLFPFISCFFASFILPLSFPEVRFLSFAPCITLALARLEFTYGLWIAACCGMVIDLFSSSLPLGFFALNYALTGTLIYRYRKYFDEESIHVFSLYTILFSFVSTLLHCILYALIHMHVPLKGITLVTDLMIMPLLDGGYALLWVLYPLTIWRFATSASSIIYYKRTWLRAQTYLKGLIWQTK